MSPSSPPKHPSKRHKSSTQQSLPELIGNLCKNISSLSNDADASSSPKQFYQKCHLYYREIIDILLKKYILVAGIKDPSLTGAADSITPDDTPSLQCYQLVELEFYISHPKFKDPYTHTATIQKHNSKWYFHRKGNSYSGGSFKGLDISVGNEHNGDEMHGGILIRTLKNLTTGEVICGPSLCVDRLLSNCGFASIKNLVHSWEHETESVFDLNYDLSLVEASTLNNTTQRLVDNFEKLHKEHTLQDTEHEERDLLSQLEDEADEPLYNRLKRSSSVSQLQTKLQESLNTQTGEWNQSLFKKVIRSLRVGIYLNDKPKSQEFCAQLLRYTSNAPLVKKGKNEMILAQLHEGNSHAEIASNVGVREKQIASKEASWKKGKSNNYSKYVNNRKPKVGEYCEMIGSLHEYIV